MAEFPKTRTFNLPTHRWCKSRFFCVRVRRLFGRHFAGQVHVFSNINTDESLGRVRSV
jgi:hypothetical protein